MAEDSKLLTLEDIEAADDSGEVEVPIAEWGGSVRIRPLTMAQVQAARRQAQQPAKHGEPAQLNEDTFQRALVCQSLVRPKLSAADYQRILLKRAGAVQKVVTAVLEAAGLTQEALDDAKAAFRPEPGA